MKDFEEMFCTIICCLSSFTFTNGTGQEIGQKQFSFFSILIINVLIDTIHVDMTVGQIYDTFPYLC